MGLDLTASPSERTAGSKYSGPIIDTDVHEAFTSLDDLVPYLEEPWRGLIVDRLGDHPRVVQVLLPLGQWAYGEPFYRPIFEAAMRHNLVIGMHQSTAVTSALGQGRYYIEWHVNVPQTAMATLTSLVCNSVFDTFPSLRFAVLESGFSWLPHLYLLAGRVLSSLLNDMHERRSARGY